MLRFDRKQKNSVKQLSFNKKIIIIIRKKESACYAHVLICPGQKKEKKRNDIERMQMGKCGVSEIRGGV